MIKKLTADSFDAWYDEEDMQRAKKRYDEIVSYICSSTKEDILKDKTIHQLKSYYHFLSSTGSKLNTTKEETYDMISELIEMQNKEVI